MVILIQSERYSNKFVYKQAQYYPLLTSDPNKNNDDLMNINLIDYEMFLTSLNN